MQGGGQQLLLLDRNQNAEPAHAGQGLQRSWNTPAETKGQGEQKKHEWTKTGPITEAQKHCFELWNSLYE